jgi:hypothetical protein
MSEDDTEILSILDSNESDDAYLLEVDSPREDVPVGEDGVITSLRSRLARQFYDGFAVSDSFDFDRYEQLAEHGRWKHEFYDPIEPEEVGEDSFRYVLRNTSGNDFEPVSISEGMSLGRIGTFNLTDIALNPDDYSEDYPKEKAETMEITNGQGFERYDWIKHPVLHPEIPEQAQERFMTAGNRIMAEINPQKRKPVEVQSTEQFSNIGLDHLVDKQDECYWKVGPGSYLSQTRQPITFDGFYTVIMDRNSPGNHHNSRVGDPEWQQPMILEHNFDQIIGEIENKETAYDFPQTINAILLQKTKSE